MPGRGKPGGRDSADKGRPDKGGPDARPGDENRGRSEWSPGHLKKDADATSARDFAPGHGGEPPGRQGRQDGTDEAERPRTSLLDKLLGRED